MTQVELLLFVCGVRPDEPFIMLILYTCEKRNYLIGVLKTGTAGSVRSRYCGTISGAHKSKPAAQIHGTEPVDYTLCFF